MAMQCNSNAIAYAMWKWMKEWMKEWMRKWRGEYEGRRNDVLIRIALIPAHKLAALLQSQYAAIAGIVVCAVKSIFQVGVNASIPAAGDRERANKKPTSVMPAYLKLRSEVVVSS